MVLLELKGAGIAVSILLYGEFLRVRPHQNIALLRDEMGDPRVPAPFQTCQLSKRQSGFT